MTGQGDLELFLDETPGETRGVVVRGGRTIHLFITRDDDAPQLRLGARVLGRVAETAPGLRGAFIDVGGETHAFLHLARNESVIQGERLEVVVTAEPRSGKGAAVRRLGPAQGEVRLLESAPSIADRLRMIAPGVPIVGGLAALDAADEAQDEALSDHFTFPAQGLDLAIQRTRALVAVDVDHAPEPGRDPSRSRAAANAHALRQAARLIGLKGWGGLVVIDVAGDGRDGEALLKTARAAFAHEPQAVFGPVSRFGLIQLSTHWKRTPIEEVLAPGVRTRAQALVRQLRRHILSDTTSARVVAYSAPDEAVVAAPLAARLGPRVLVRADAALAPGRSRIEEA